LHRALSDEDSIPCCLFREVADDEKRLLYLLNDPVISAFDVQPRREGKDAAKSAQMRLEANAAFSGRDFDVALKFFSKSVVLAETPSLSDGRFVSNCVSAGYGGLRMAW
jgi:hypothetical protein